MDGCRDVEDVRMANPRGLGGYEDNRERDAVGGRVAGRQGGRQKSDARRAMPEAFTRDTSGTERRERM